VRLRRFGLELERTPVARQFVLQARDIAQCVADNAMRIGKTWLELKRPAVAREHIVQPPEIPERVAEVAMCYCEVGFDRECASASCRMVE
jgi:hypothetical protein